MSNTWITEHSKPEAIEALRSQIVTDERYERVRRSVDDWARGDGLASDFACWLSVCDAVCERKVGVSIFDISDWNWRDAFLDDRTPRAAVWDALMADDPIAAMFGDD